MLVGLSYHGSRMLHDLSCGCHDVTALQPNTENGWPKKVSRFSLQGYEKEIYCFVFRLSRRRINLIETAASSDFAAHLGITVIPDVT